MTRTLRVRFKRPHLANRCPSLSQKTERRLYMCGESVQLVAWYADNLVERGIAEYAPITESELKAIARAEAAQ